MTVPASGIPAPIQPGSSHSLRFAVGSPDGPRSTTWIVIGGRTRPEVYVGARGYTGIAKLSLHASGDWRYAYTDKYAKAIHLETDRVLSTLRPPTPILPGWRRAATIIIPTNSLRPAFPEKKSKEPISWWPATKPGRTINFEIMISEPKFDETASFEGIGEVGRIPLPGGGNIWVVADEQDYRPWQSSFEKMCNDVYAQSTRTPASHWPASQNLAFGTSNDDGHAIFFDLGDLRQSIGDNN